MITAYLIFLMKMSCFRKMNLKTNQKPVQNKAKYK